MRITMRLPTSLPASGMEYLPEKNRLVLASSNGVSLVGVPDGELLHFWQVGEGNETGPYLVVSSESKAVLAVVDGEGIFQIPMEP